MEWLAAILVPAAIGAAAGEVLLGKRLGNQALAWGAALATGPWLLEGLAGLVLSNSLAMVCHAALAHSVWSVAAAAFFLPKWLGPKWKRAKIPRGRLVAFCGLAWAAPALWHGLGITGAQFLWPIPCPRVALCLVAPGDAAPGILLACGLIALAPLRTKKELPKRRRRWWWGVGLAAGYLGLMAAAKLLAGAGFRADLTRRGMETGRVCACPTAWNPLLWRGIAIQGDDVWLGERSVWEWPSTPMRWTVVSRGGANLTAETDGAEAARVDAFTGGWWIRRPNKTGMWLADLRLGTHRVWGERKGMVDFRFRRAWWLEPGTSGDPLRPLRPETGGTAEQLKRLARRSFGDRAACDGLPRLAGVPGALPEILRTAD